MSNYSTVAKVRQESGFSNNEDIIDDDIQRHLDNATSRINGVVAVRYSLTNLAGANFTGSPAEKLLRLVEEQLASGYLLNAEYGAEDTNPKNGNKKIAEAEKILKDILTGKQLLIGVDESELTTRGARAGGTPILTGGVTDELPRNFSVADKY